MIKSISFRKFKSFPNVTISLHPFGLSYVAGGNNSGKSTVLHGMAIWEFCRTVIEAEKGFDYFILGSKHQGLGIGDDEFSPINVPTLRHLWTNLLYQKGNQDPDGYTLRIKCTWEYNGVDKFLEFGLALANDRLFIKTTESNLIQDDIIPRVVFLPPFAGMTDNETRVTPAIRRRRIGEGLAGSVLRNMLLDLYQENRRKRIEYRGSKSKISDADLKSLRETDPWELVQQALRTIFKAELFVSPFQDEYHTYIKIEIIKGNVKGYKLTRYPPYKKRDIMVEGSGFLQWLSVYALASDPRMNVLLFDEPDAHLHYSLQENLIQKLSEIAAINNKQVIVATHSTELLRQSPPELILCLHSDHPPHYLSEEHQKIGFFAGLGTEYSPRIDKVKHNKRILFVEAEADIKILQKISKKLDLGWPARWVAWVNKSGHKERKHIFIAFQEEINDLVAVSIRDRDDENINTVDENLADNHIRSCPNNLHCKLWRRRNIESYLIWPEAIALTIGKQKEEIEETLRNSFGIAVGDTFTDIHPPEAICQIDGKKVLRAFNANPIDVIDNLPKEKIPEDIINLIKELINLEN